MKKLWAIVCVLTCLLGLVGCDPGTRRIDEDKLLSNIERIELYYYENTNPKSYRIDGKRKPVFDFSKASYIATLDESRMDEVLMDIAEQELLVFGNTHEPIGKTLVLYQSNGNMVVLFSCVTKNAIGLTKYYGECNIYDETGVFIENIGRIGSDYVDELELEFFDN